MWQLLLCLRKVDAVSDPTDPVEPVDGAVLELLEDPTGIGLDTTCDVDMVSALANALGIGGSVDADEEADGDGLDNKATQNLPAGGPRSGPSAGAGVDLLVAVSASEVDHLIASKWRPNAILGLAALEARMRAGDEMCAAMSRHRQPGSRSNIIQHPILMPVMIMSLLYLLHMWRVLVSPPPCGPATVRDSIRH